MGDWASTERISAGIALAEQLELRGELHVQGRVAQHDGPETPLEMLNRADAFFPVTLPEGKVAFVAKSQVAVVACAPEIGQSDPDRASAAKTIRLEIVMANGAEFRGWATLELPPTREPHTQAAEALADFRSRPAAFDIVLTDLAMPGASGMDFARNVLALRPDIPVIMTTGYIDPADLELARRIGVREIILKPTTIQEMARACHRQLAARHRP